MKYNPNELCPKCHGHMSVKYDNSSGILWIKCNICGFQGSRDPMDAKEDN